MYAILTNGMITQYPANPRADHPDTSFGEGWRGGIVNGIEYVWVAGTAQPTYDSKTQKVVEGTPTLLDGVWTQTWTVELLSEDECAANLAAWRSSLKATRFQAKAALHRQGKLEAVHAMIAASSDPVVSLAWNDAAEFERTSPVLNQIAQEVGLSDTDLDLLFVIAQDIRV